MPSFTLTYTCGNASCLTFSGRTAEAIVGAADGISGGMIPDQFVLYIISAILAFVTLVVGLVLTNKKKGN